MDGERIPGFRDLKVWQRSMDLTLKVYEITEQYPERERYGLTSETRKSARSVPSNIAEGKSRYSPHEYRHFISIARGSLGELQTQVILGNRLKYLSDTAFTQVDEQMEEIARMLRGLERSLT